MKILKDMDQNSSQWFEIRNGLLTASQYSSVLTAKTLKQSSNDIHFKLAAEVIAGYDPDPWMGNSATEHGLEAEKEAVKLYEAETGLKCEKVGFVMVDDGSTGCSPDRFVGDDGLLEIKSPLAKNMIKTYCGAMESKECPSEYSLQIQGQLMITKREWCDLVLYHPALGIKILRVYPDLDIQEKLCDAISEVNRKRDEVVSLMVDF